MINIIITACHQGAFCHETPRRTRESHTGPAPFFPGSRAGGSSTGQTRHYSSHTHTAHTEGSPVSVPAPIKPPNPCASTRSHTYPTIIVRPAGRRGFDPSHGAGAELGGGHGGRRAGAGSWARGRPGGDEGGGGEEGPRCRRRRQEGARVGVRFFAGADDAARSSAHGAQPWLPVAVREQAFGGVDAGIRREPGAVVRGLGLGRLRGRGGGRAGGHRRGDAGGRLVLAQRQRGLLPDGLLRAGRPRRRRRCPRRRRLARQRRGRRRLGAQETAPLQGAGRVPGGELQGAQHPQPQAEGGAGEAAQPPAAPGGGVVPEPESQDEAEADGGGLRVPEAVLRDADGGEPAAAEGAGGAARAQDGAPLLHAPPGDHPLHVPVLRARRLQLRPGRRRGPLARGRGARLRRRHWGGRRFGAEQALVVRRAVLVGQELPAGLVPAPGSIAGAVELVTSPAGEGRACL